MTALLDVQDLTVLIPGAAGEALILDELGFSVAAGESVGIVGESGCGKSMTALAIMGLLPGSATVRGRILLRGRDLLELSEADYCRIRGRRIAMVFQEPMTALNPVKTIGAQIAEGMRLHLRVSRAAAEQRARGLLDRVGLPAARYSPQLYPHQLSGGQRQRVVLAIALACEPDLLIADEPTTALDVVVQQQILELIMQVVAEEGMGLLLITHDLGIVAETTDRVNVMYAGKLVEHGATLQVFERMAHPYTHGLFRAMPQAAAMRRKRRLNTIPGIVPDPWDRPAGCVFSNRCERVQARCRAAQPGLMSVAAGHGAACYFPILENGMKHGF